MKAREFLIDDVLKMYRPSEYFLPVTGKAQAGLRRKGDDEDRAAVKAGVAP